MDIFWTMFKEALPYAVTIVTIIGSSYVQIKTAGIETDRMIKHNEHLYELEQLKLEEVRKSAALNQQIEETRQIYLAMTELYYPMVDALYELKLGGDPRQSFHTIYSNATKLLSRCGYHSGLYYNIWGLVEHMDNDVLPKIDNPSEYLDQMHFRIKNLGTDIFNSTFTQQSISENTVPPAPPPQQCSKPEPQRVRWAFGRKKKSKAQDKSMPSP